MSVMLNATVQISMSILTVAAALSLIAVTVSWITRQRRPALEHACWLLVLLRMVTPPVLPLSIPGYPQWSLEPSISHQNVAAFHGQDHDKVAAATKTNSIDYESAQRFPKPGSDDRREPIGEQSAG